MIVTMIPFKNIRQSSSTIGFFAIIVLLFTDKCLGQQRRNKSGASASASSASQVVDFDCPEEFGYYPHPDDCTQYYVCVFGGALLESCTGGLMYSHELQTCDWPRNVGCGGEGVVSDGNGGGVVATVSTVRVTDARTRQSTNTRTPVPVQRERPIQRESIPKHHLYTEEDLGPAEEIESDRQQRVYRGQPATLGQVARDRDGLNRHTNAIQPAPGNGREKLSVVSFGTQQQYSRATIAPPSYVEQQPTTVQPVSSRGYNTSQQQYNQQQYDPYYNLYEDDAEIYKDIDYGQYSNQQNQNQQQYRGQYKDKQREVVQQQVIQAPSPQRKPTYIQPQQQSYSVPDVYSQSVSAQDYNDNYNLQVDDEIQYNKQSDLDNKINRSVPEADTKGSKEAAPSLEATNPIALALKPSSSNSRRLTLTAAFSLDTPNPPITSSKLIQKNQNSGRRSKINSFTVQNSDDKNDKTHEELILSYINEDNAYKSKNRLNLQIDNKANPLSTYDTKPDESRSKSIQNSRGNYSREQIRAINNLEELVPIQTIYTSPSSFNVQESEERLKTEYSKQATISDRLNLPQAQFQPKPIRLIIGVGRSSNYNKESLDKTRSGYKTQESLILHPSTSQNLNYENSNILKAQDKYTPSAPKPTVPIITSTEKLLKNRVQNPQTDPVDNKTNHQTERLYSRHNYRIITTTDSNLDGTSKHFRIRSRNRLPEIIQNEDISFNEKSQAYDSHEVATNDYKNVDSESVNIIRPRIRSTTLESIVDETNKSIKTRYKYDEKETSTEATIYVTPEQRSRTMNQGNDKIVSERVNLNKNFRLITTTEPTIVNAATERVYRGKFRNTNTDSTLNKHYGLNERFQTRVSNFRTVTSTKSNIFDENPEQFYINQLSKQENTDGKEFRERANMRISTQANSEDVSSSETYRRRVQNLDVKNNFSDNANQKFQSQLNRYQIPSSIEPSTVDSKSDDESENHGSEVFESIEDGNSKQNLLHADNSQVRSSTETNLFYTTTERTYRRRPSNLVVETRGTFRDTTETDLLNEDKITRQPYSSHVQNIQVDDIKNKTPSIALSNRRFAPRSTTQISEVETSTNYRKSNYIMRERTNQNVFSDNRESNLVPTASTIFVTNEIESNSDYQAYPSSTTVSMEDTRFERINTELGDIEDAVDVLVDEPPSTIGSLTEFRIDNSNDNNENKFVKDFKPRSQGRYNFRGRSQYQATTERQLYNDYDDETSFEVKPEIASTTQRSRYRQPIIKNRAQTKTKILVNNTNSDKKNSISPRVIAIEIQPILNENIQNYNNLNTPIAETREIPNSKISNIDATNETYVIDIPVPSRPFVQGEYFEDNLGSIRNEEIKSARNSLPVYENRQRQNQYSENLSIKLTNKPFVSNNAVNSPEIINKPDTKPLIRNYIKNRPIKNNDPIEIENSEPDPNLNINTTTYESSSTKTNLIKPSLLFKSQLLRSEVGNDARSRSPQSSPVRCSQLDSQCNEKSFVRVRPTTASPDSQSTPGLTRGNGRNRGSATYTISPNEAEPAVSVSRGTPSSINRNRPTLKPSTSIVSKAQEFVDIYRFPPSRPEPIYPTPQVDKTAAKCRKDVCLLPDCSCGGKDNPGDLPLEETPQLVLLTFDDSVNDLNKGLYSDLFDKGRTNPNGCPISATFYVSHEWTDYSQVQNLYATGHEIASHSVSHSFGEQFSQKKWTREIAGQREILSAYGGVRQEDIRGMRAPFLAVGGNKMFKMLYDSNFTYDSSMPVYENKPPSWPYTLDYKIFHDCMIPPCPTRSYPGVWEVPMVMWQDLNGGRCSMGDACSNPPTSDGVYKMLVKNFERHFTSNRAPFGLFYHAAWFTQPHHKEGFIAFLDTIVNMPEVWVVTNWQALQWVRDPTPISRLNNFGPFQCNYPERPRKCNNPKVCNLWHKSGVRYMRTCQPCPDIYPWTGKSGVRTSRVDNEIINE